MNTDKDDAIIPPEHVDHDAVNHALQSLGGRIAMDRKTKEQSVEPLSEEAVKEIEARANAATAGPWQVYQTPYTLTDLGRQQGFGEDRQSVVNAIGQAWDHPQLKGPLPIITTTHGPYYDPQHAVKIENEDADFIAHARTDIPALCESLRAAWKERNEAYISERENCEALERFNVQLTTGLVNIYHAITGEQCKHGVALGMATSAVSALKSDNAALREQLAEEKRLRSELKQIAQVGIEEVSSVGAALQANAVRDATERAATRMRDKCVVQLRKRLHDPTLRFADDGIKATVTDWTNMLISIIESLTLDAPDHEEAKP